MAQVILEHKEFLTFLPRDLRKQEVGDGEERPGAFLRHVRWRSDHLGIRFLKYVRFGCNILSSFFNGDTYLVGLHRETVGKKA